MRLLYQSLPVRYCFSLTALEDIFLPAGSVVFTVEIVSAGEYVFLSSPFADPAVGFP